MFSQLRFLKYFRFCNSTFLQFFWENDRQKLQNLIFTCHIHMDYEGSVGFDSRKMTKKNIADFHVIGLFMAKKSDAQVRRVNTFHILQTIRKRPSNYKFCTGGPLRFQKFKTLSA
jgi:hypothetical protein